MSVRSLRCVFHRSQRSWRCVVLLGVILGALPTVALRAQHTSNVRAVVLVGSDRDDVLRFGSSRDSIGAPSWLVVSRRSAQLNPQHGSRRSFAALLPHVGISAVSAIPAPLEAGGQLAARGVNASFTAGGQARLAGLSVQLLPQLFVSQNRPVAWTTWRDPRDGASPWRFPFVIDRSSIDLPLRFGEEVGRVATWGQSYAAVAGRLGEVGISHEVRWWGPGRRNALMLGNHHEGFPHAYLQTERVLRGASRVRLELLSGRLRESRYFDTTRANDRRGIAAVQVAFSSGPELAGFTTGVQRLVVRAQNADPRDAFRRTAGNEAQQAAGVFARYATAGGASEAWMEWLRFSEPAGLRDLLVYPGRTQAYTMGFAWRPADRTRIELEHTNSEPDASSRRERTTPSYAGIEVPQGFTQAGRPLGSAIGPGSSSQWIALDHDRRDGTRLGVHLQRVRWHNAHRTDPRLTTIAREDVSLIAGARADRLRLWSTQVGVSYGIERRLNYLFASTAARDRLNHVLRFQLTADRP